MTDVKVSVIIPLYNVKKEWLQDCLDSVANQTFPDFEVLIIDDGSTDGSGAVCDEYAEKDSRFRVVHKENGGVSMARNIGLARAKGEWIVFLDCDDHFDVAALEKLNAYQADTDADILYFAYTSAQSGGGERAKKICKISLSDREIFSEIAKRAALLNSIGNARYSDFSDVPDLGDVHFQSVWAKAYRKAFLTRENLRFHEDIRVIEDLAFNVECLMKNAGIMYADFPLYFHRSHMTSLSYRYTPNHERVRDFQLAFQYLAKALGKIAEEPDMRIALDVFISCWIYNIALSDMAHPNNPNPYSQRLRDFKAFVRSEPCRSAIKAGRLKRIPLGRCVKAAVILLRLKWENVCLKLLERRASMRYADRKR